MRYILMSNVDGKALGGLPPEEHAALFSRFVAFTQALAESGVCAAPSNCSPRTPPPRCGSVRRGRADRRPVGRRRRGRSAGCRVVEAPDPDTALGYARARRGRRWARSRSGPRRARRSVTVRVRGAGAACTDRTADAGRRPGALVRRPRPGGGRRRRRGRRRGGPVRRATASPTGPAPGCRPSPAVGCSTACAASASPRTTSPRGVVWRAGDLPDLTTHSTSTRTRTTCCDWSSSAATSCGRRASIRWPCGCSRAERPRRRGSWRARGDRRRGSCAATSSRSSTRWRARAPPEARLVVYHSAVLTYLSSERRAAFARAVARPLRPLARQRVRVRPRRSPAATPDRPARAPARPRPVPAGPRRARAAGLGRRARHVAPVAVGERARLTSGDRFGFRSFSWKAVRPGL